MNLISGDKFISLCNIQYMPGEVLLPPEGKLIFVKTDHFTSFVNYCKLRMQNKFVCLVHDSDGNIQNFNTGRDFDFYFRIDEFPQNIELVFCQNCNIEDKRFIPIPIGLENFKWHKGSKFTDTLKVMSEPSHGYNQWLYINHAKGTNKERELPYKILPFATKKTKIPYLDYIRDMRKHYFTLCPPGNGIDTHRLWEALYIGSIPVTLRYKCYEYFKQLGFPILIVDSWYDLNIQLLQSAIKDFGRWDYKNKLDFDFWENLIFTKMKVAK